MKRNLFEKYSPFNEKTSNYYMECLKPENWLCIAEGGIRAGKNVINILAWCAIIDEHPDTLHLAAGVNRSIAMLNIYDSNGFGLENYFKGRCKKGKYKDMDCMYLKDTMGREKIILFVGGKTNADYKVIRGASIGSAYVTEANELAFSFIQEVFNRTTSSRQRKIFFDFNPKPPRHAFYKELLDEFVQLDSNMNLIACREGIAYEHFTLLDNGSFSDDKIRQILSTYNKNSQWYKADVLGLRVASQDRIYLSYNEKEHLKKMIGYGDNATFNEIKEDEKYIDRFTQFYVGVDIGGTDATVATLTGINRNTKEVFIIDGFYNKQDMKNLMTHETYAQLIGEKIVEWTQRFPNRNFSIYSDSADKLFRRALQNYIIRKTKLNITVNPSFKKDGILQRIRATEMLFGSNKLFISPHLQLWVDAFENATWNVKEFEKGEWVRLDDGSFPVDCLDSFEYTISPFIKELI